MHKLMCDELCALMIMIWWWWSQKWFIFTPSMSFLIPLHKKAKQSFILYLTFLSLPPFCYLFSLKETSFFWNSPQSVQVWMVLLIYESVECSIKELADILLSSILFKSAQFFTKGGKWCIWIIFLLSHNYDVLRMQRIVNHITKHLFAMIEMRRWNKAR